MILDYREVLVPNETPYKSFQEHINRYSFASRFVRNKLVLDVACGVGYGSSYLRHVGAKMVIGGDISKDHLDYAKKHYLYGRGITFVCLDAMELPFSDKCFDVVVAMETIEHLENYRKFLSECKRVLKKGGKFVCSTPNKLIFSPHAGVSVPIHFHEFYIQEFYSLLTQYFANIKLYGQRFTTIGNIIVSDLIYYGSKILDHFPKGVEIKKIMRQIIYFHKSSKETNPIAKLGIEIRDEIIDKKYRVRPYEKSLLASIPGCLIAVAET